MGIGELCKTSDGDFFTQTLWVEEVKEHSWEYCKKISEGKKVLHLGCSDYPLYQGGTNMHVFLAPFCGELVGCDTNGLDVLRKSYGGQYYNSIKEVVHSKEPFDVILVPNIIEHLPNPGQMVDDLFEIDHKEMFVLVPNYFIAGQAVYKNGIFTEKVHPDHYMWYSPYTLLNLFRPQVQKHNLDCKLMFFSGKDMIGLFLKKQ